MLRNTYDRLMRLAASRHAIFWLAAAAWAEGVFFPIPPDVMLMPMVLAKRDHAWRYAAVCSAASIVGGCTGYAAGYFLHPFGQWLLDVTGYGGIVLKFQHFYGHWGALLIALPIPYKLTSIASGLAKFNFAVFIGASVVVRSARFFAVAWLIRHYGPPIQGFIEKRLALVISAVAVAIVALVLALKMLH